MVNLTAKELSALEDQISHEQTLIKKYEAMACLCNSPKIQQDITNIANKHSGSLQHPGNLFAVGGYRNMANPNQCAQILGEKEMCRTAS